MVLHPMMLGLLIGFWATPRMTLGHLLFAFAGGMTIYMLIGLQFEERDLTAAFGEEYRRYQQDTPMLVPLPVRLKKRNRMKQDFKEI